MEKNSYCCKTSDITYRRPHIAGVDENLFLWLYLLFFSIRSIFMDFFSLFTPMNIFCIEFLLSFFEWSLEIVVVQIDFEICNTEFLVEFQVRKVIFNFTIYHFFHEVFHRIGSNLENLLWNAYILFAQTMSF